MIEASCLVLCVCFSGYLSSSCLHRGAVTLRLAFSIKKASCTVRRRAARKIIVCCANTQLNRFSRFIENAFCPICAQREAFWGAFYGADLSKWSRWSDPQLGLRSRCHRPLGWCENRLRWECEKLFFSGRQSRVADWTERQAGKTRSTVHTNTTHRNWFRVYIARLSGKIHCPMGNVHSYGDHVCKWDSKKNVFSRFRTRQALNVSKLALRRTFQKKFSSQTCPKHLWLLWVHIHRLKLTGRHVHILSHKKHLEARRRPKGCSVSSIELYYCKKLFARIA